MQIRRWKLTDGAEGALYPEPSLTEFVKTTAVFLEQSGLAISDVVASPVTAIPVPVYADGGRPRRPWDVRPEFMWHPLMWLPGRLQMKARVTMPDGTAFVETDEQWAVRVLTEMQGAGPFSALGRRWVRLADYRGVPVVKFRQGRDGVEFPDRTYDFSAARCLRPVTRKDEKLLSPYDPSDGTWLDVPYLVGVDVTTRDGLARMERWLAGGSDSALDSLDLDAYIRAEGRDDMWAMNECYRLFDQSEADPDAPLTTLSDDVIGAGFFLAASSAYTSCMTFVDALAEGVDEAQVRQSLAGLVTVLAACLPGLRPGWDLGDRLAAVEKDLGGPLPHEDLERIIRIAADCVFAVALALEPDYLRLVERDGLARRDMAIELVDRYGLPIEQVESIAA